ncbi:MAG: hypothetical protein JXA67_21070 [Micromonosporaceae bacterium]|nr:hypothetical protein [Micromonosporaceae bacterium]
MSATDRGRHVRLARAMAAMADLRYQTALDQVLAAAAAGRLPDLLDPAGMRRALDLLLQQATTADGGSAAAAGSGDHAGGRHTATALLEPRYYRLTEVIARLQPGVTDRVARAQAAGAWPALLRRAGDLFEVNGVDEEDLHWDDTEGDGGMGGHAPGLPDWWLRAKAAGVRPDYALPCHYPPTGTADGHLPIDLALEQREADGDLDAYERELRRIIEVEPHDIDAYAHLGHLWLNSATPGGRIVHARPPTAAQHRRWLLAALTEYQTAILIGELALPDPFTGFLVWGELNNRPFHRAMHGLGLALWRLGRFQAAELTMRNSLWLNPLDHQGIQELLAEVTARRPWQPDEDR